MQVCADTEESKTERSEDGKKYIFIEENWCVESESLRLEICVVRQRARVEVTRFHID